MVFLVIIFLLQSDIQFGLSKEIVEANYIVLDVDYPESRSEKKFFVASVGRSNTQEYGAF